MTTYRIPPVGWCVTCLIAFDEERPAVALFKGTSLCQDHIMAVLEPDLAAALEKLGADADADESEEAGT